MLLTDRFERIADAEVGGMQAAASHRGQPLKSRATRSSTRTRARGWTLRALVLCGGDHRSPPRESRVFAGYLLTAAAPHRRRCAPRTTAAPPTCSARRSP